jgi:hypothetical protein
MVAGGLTFAAPSMAPEAYAEDNMMYVSCVNEDFGNTFAGGQVCEVIVRDPSIAETDQDEPEPTVEVNEEKLAMVQGADGYWYAYFASTAGVASADANTNIDYGAIATTNHKGTACPPVGKDQVGSDDKGHGAEYGFNQITCSSAATIYLYNSTISEKALWGTNLMVTDGFPDLSDHDGTDLAPESLGQHNVTLADWPFIQTWEFKDDSSVSVVYEKPGTDEVVDLTFETAGTGMEDYAKLVLDRYSAAPGSEIHMTIYDNQLNIDPTTEDSVIFLTNAN